MLLIGHQSHTAVYAYSCDVCVGVRFAHTKAPASVQTQDEVRTESESIMRQMLIIPAVVCIIGQDSVEGSKDCTIHITLCCIKVDPWQVW